MTQIGTDTSQPTISNVLASRRQGRAPSVSGDHVRIEPMLSSFDGLPCCGLRLLGGMPAASLLDDLACLLKAGEHTLEIVLLYSHLRG
jgi:hypothetical protein